MLMQCCTAGVICGRESPVDVDDRRIDAGLVPKGANQSYAQADNSVPCCIIPTSALRPLMAVGSWLLSGRARRTFRRAAR